MLTWPNEDDHMNLTEICEHDQKIDNDKPQHGEHDQKYYKYYHNYNL